MIFESLRAGCGPVDLSAAGDKLCCFVTQSDIAYLYIYFSS